MSSTHFERPKRTNAPMQPRTKENKTMKLKECTTCGSHEFNGNKCAYCGNVYEMEEQAIITDEEYNEKMSELKAEEKELREELGLNEVKFEDTPAGKKTLKVMVWILVSIIWFAVTVFIPPLFLLTICDLIICGCKWLIKKGEKNNS